MAKKCCLLTVLVLLVTLWPCRVVASDVVNRLIGQAADHARRLTVLQYARFRHELEVLKHFLGIVLVEEGLFELNEEKLIDVTIEGQATRRVEVTVDTH